jgi:quercetin dioxygenase-like cupin family protein
MIHPGDTLENPVTGEVLVFHRTSSQTQGESVLVETIVRPDGFVAAAHVHPNQSERFEILAGTLGLRLGNQELLAKPGDVAVVDPGTPHRFWNAGDQDARFLCEVRPALDFESLIETMFALAAEGKTNSKGPPNPLRLAVIAEAPLRDGASVKGRRSTSCAEPTRISAVRDNFRDTRHRVTCSRRRRATGRVQ